MYVTRINQRLDMCIREFLRNVFMYVFTLYIYVCMYVCIYAENNNM